jgi:glutathione S-transferase
MLVQQNKGGKFVFGDSVTCADVFLYPQIYNSIIRYNIDLSPYPKLLRIFNNLAEVKEFQDSAPERQKDFD